MDSRKTTFDELRAKVFEAGKKAKAEGYVPPDGTYTFNNKEAAVMIVSLNIAEALLEGDIDIVLAYIAILKLHGTEVKAIFDKISSEIVAKQCPAFISEAVDEFAKEQRQTDKRYS